MIVSIIKALSPDENVESIIDDLNMEDFTSLSEQVGEIINTQKKTKKSQQTIADKQLKNDPKKSLMIW